METDNESTRQARCGNSMCKCTVPAGQKYCGGPCSKAAEGSDSAKGTRCGCTHAACDETAG